MVKSSVCKPVNGIAASRLCLGLGLCLCSEVDLCLKTDIIESEEEKSRFSSILFRLSSSMYLDVTERLFIEYPKLKFPP